MRNKQRTVLTLIAGVALTMLVSSFAAPNTARADELTCGEIDFLGALFDARIEAELDEQVAGTSKRINRRKRLVINHIQDVRVDGCRITVVANVTLKRKIRRDARGTVTLKGNVTVDNLGGSVFDLSFSNVRVTDVSLSNTLRIGEAVYRWVANIVLPNSRSVRVEL